MNSLVKTAHFDMSTIPDEFRLEAWRQMLAASHDVNSSETEFSGRMRSTLLGEMIVHVMEASPLSIERGTRKIRRDGLEHFVLHLNPTPALAEINGREIAIPSQRVSINDLSRTSRRSEVPELGSIIVSMSRELVTEAIGHSDKLHGSIVEHGAGALLIAHLRQLAQLAPTVDENAAPAVAKGTAHLLAACLAPSRDNAERARPMIESATLFRARSYIEAHLGDFDLGPEAICKQVAVSRSTLFRLFEAFGGVSSYILQRRLRAARRNLSDARVKARISEVASKYGFSSDARFSREFKKNFGVSPRDFVREGDAIQASEKMSDDLMVATWIRSLG